jgi:hypothetical protein
MAIALMQALGAADLQLFTGKKDPDIVRKLSYNALVSKQLGKLILVCDEGGNRTFVLHTTDQPERFWKMTKTELKALSISGEASELPWSNPAEWTQKLQTFLLSEFRPNPSSCPMDAPYFTKTENIRKDLGAYASSQKCPIEELTTLKMRNSKDIPCANGEKLKGHAYLLRFAVAMGMAKTQAEASSTPAIILDQLKCRIGIEIPERKSHPKMDSAYFADAGKVRKDLEAFATKCECAVEALIPSQITEFEIVCSNGEEVKGHSYLRRAAVGLKLVKTQTQSDFLPSKTVDQLKRAVGIEVPERKTYPEMDKAYFENPDHIRADLHAFASESECEVEALSTSKMSDHNAICSTGRKLNGFTYLRKAGISLEIAKDRAETCAKQTQTLKELKKRIGIQTIEKRQFQKMDKAYFENPDHIRADLEGFAARYGCGIGELTTRKVNESKAVCSNGEEVSGNTFLRRATLGMGLALAYADSSRFNAKTLDQLKTRIGISAPERKQYPPMDEAYFADAMKIRNDLEGFATKWKCGLDALTVYKLMESKTSEVQCSNGESINGITYIMRAGVAMKMAKNHTDRGDGKAAKILSSLIGIAKTAQ